MPMRDGCPAPLASWRTPAQPRHLGRGATFIDEDQPFGIKIGLGVEPGFAATCHVGALLFAGMRRLF